MCCFIGRHSISLLAAFYFLFFSLSVHSQTNSEIPAGSLIIDMGVVPQTIENGLKPYGLAYELINIRKVPVVWAINSSKAKDGVDFTVDGRDFSGGPFILEAPYLADPDVQTSIANWQAKGVVTYTTLTDVTVEVYRTINIWPKWVLDENNGSIAENYLELAEIPASAYAIGLPSDLDACDDLFILPHADPTWEDHGYLYEWNKSFADGGSEGWIWSGCHAVSVFEALVNPLDPTERMNFLAEDPSPFPDPLRPGLDGYALIDFGDHDSGSGGPYLYSNPTDSFMQFMGSLDGATEGGSEQIYLPYPTGSWRASTTVAVWDPNQSDVLNGDSPGKAAKLAYGHAFGDTERGQVMYEGGHSLLNGSDAERVAAIRAFLNFSFNAPTKKAPILTDNISVPTLVEGGDSINFDVDASSTAGNSYTFIWETTCAGGTFTSTTQTSNNTTATFETIPVTASEQCIITVRVIDLCGRESFRTYPITIVPPPFPPDAKDDFLNTYQENNITFNALSNDTDINFNINPASFTPLTSLTVAGGTFANLGNGNIRFEPADGFVGTANLQYQICDDTPAGDGGPFCDAATITVNVVATPCGPNEPVSSVTDYASSVFSENNWKDSGRAFGPPDTDGSKSDNDIGAFLVLDLGDEAFMGSEILFRVFSSDGDPYTGSVDAAATGTGFPNNPMAVSTSAQEPATEMISYTVQEPGIRYVRITGVKEFGLESVEYQRVVCLDPPTPPVAADDLQATYDISDITFNALDNDTDINNNLNPSSFNPLTSLTVSGGTFVNLGNGAVRFEPVEGFVGTATLQYQICDDTPAEDGGPLCDTATITVNLVATPCGPGEPVTSETDYASTVFSENNWKDSDRALGAPDIDRSGSDNDIGAFLVLDLGDEALIGSEILFRVNSADGNPYAGSVDAAATGTGFPNNPMAISTSTEEPASEVISYTVQQPGIRYVRITGAKDFGLESVEYQRVVCLDPPTPPVAEDDLYATYDINNISFNALDNDTDINNNLDASSFSPLSSLVVAGGQFLNYGNGFLGFVPNEGFAGMATLQYQICDDTPIEDGGPLCDTATITVQVVTTPCGPGEPVTSETDYALSIYSETNWANADRALGVPDTNFSKSNNDTGAELILDLGSEAFAGSEILFRIFSDNGTTYSGTIDAAASPTGFPNNAVAVSVSTEDPATDLVSLLVSEAGIRYVRITGVKDFGLESVEYQRVVCLDPPTPPVAEDDIYGTYDVNSLTFNALDNDTDINGNIDPASFSPLTSLTVAGGTFVNLGNGAIRFEPLQGYSGTATLQYQICDDTPAWEGGPFCDTATITIQVVASPCGPAQYPEGITAYATSVFSENKWKDSNRALGPSDTDFSKSDDDATGWIILDLGGTALIGSEIEFRLASDDGSTYSGTVDAAVNTTGFPNNPIAVSVSVQDPGSVVVSFPVTEAGLRYVRVAGLSKLMLESVQYEMETCTSLPVIDAVVDDFSGTPINGGAGGQAGELTLNDTQDGLPVDAADFNLSIVDNDGLAGASIDAAGNLLVPPGTAAGTYVLSYSICEKSHPSNCDTATATVAVVWPTVITNRRITFRVNKY